MKQLIFAFTMMIGFALTANAQTAAMDKNGTSGSELKKHKCTQACHTSGHCVYAHGEKKHVCTDACKTASATPMPAESKQHGQPGHVCTDACKKM
jgi:hypothetical protein